MNLIRRRAVLKAGVAVPVAWQLLGCAASGPRYSSTTPAPGKALIYIYRVHLADRKMDLAPMILLNDKEIGGLPEEGFLVASVEPGTVIVRTASRAYLWPTGSPLDQATVDAVAGGTYFVQFTVTHASVRFPRGVPGPSVVSIGSRMDVKTRQQAEPYLSVLRKA